jgi:2-keto-myo-inositol isomerase
VGELFPFKPALNASTLFPYQLSVTEQIRIAAEAGYEAIELWVPQIETFVQQGGTLKQIRAEAETSAVRLVNAIAFFEWAVADEGERAAGLRQAESQMNQLAEIGCEAIAVPPMGNLADVTLDEMAERFAVVAELARRTDVLPLLEFWGRASKMSTLDETLYVADRSGVPDARILLDPFHMYTGGSQWDGVSRLAGGVVGMVHVNDFPAEPAKDRIQDRDRLFPGEGIAPLRQLASQLNRAGYAGYVSLELFQEEYGGQNALETARTGLAKMKDAMDIG